MLCAQIFPITAGLIGQNVSSNLLFPLCEMEALEQTSRVESTGKYAFIQGVIDVGTKNRTRHYWRCRNDEETG